MVAAKKEPAKAAGCGAAGGTSKRTKATKGQGLDNAEATKMRQWLKYNAANAKEEEVMRKAQAALAIWDQCKAPSERRNFMESFRNDKNKDLAWTHTFFEEVANEEVHKDSAKSGYLTTSQALAHWNLTMGDFKTHEEALAFVESQWEENSETFGTKEEKPPKMDPQDRALLHKFYFVLEQMQEDEFVTRDQKKISGAGDVKNTKALAWAAERMSALPGSSSSSSGVQIKLENELWPKIQESKDTLQPAPQTRHALTPR